MANFRYFADLPNGETIQFTGTIRHNGQGRGAKNFSGYVDGKWVAATRAIEMKTSPSRHACDDRCLNATGKIMKCECSCGGENHGKGAFFCEAA